jgi:GNAT superfamily N-acetyltransferase
MTSNNVEIRSADPDDCKAVVDVLAPALGATEIAEYLVPDPVQRRLVYRRYFELMVPWFLDFGQVYLTDGGAGAAMWVSCAGRFEPHIDDYDARLAQACGDATERFVALDAAMHDQHPDSPHMYLAFLGVDPDAQCRGIGSALLAHQHAILDAELTAAFLVATSRRNAGLYWRHGYRARPAFPIGPGGPHLGPMWRWPHVADNVPRVH